MTQQYTPAQLEAWAGLSWKLALSDDTTILDKDRRIVAELCCSDNEDPGHLDYNNPDEWPLLERNAALIAAAPDLARLVLEKEKEIAELKFEAGMKDKAIRLALKRLKELTDQTGTGALFASDIALIRQVMKETSDE